MLTTEEYNDKPTGSNDGRTTQMTDEYLIAMLRNNVGVSEAACRAAKAAADRIEQLVAEKEATTAAAYEVAVSWLIDAGIAGDGKDDPLASSIRALATPDQTAALDRLITEAVKPYLDALTAIGDLSTISEIEFRDRHPELNAALDKAWIDQWSDELSRFAHDAILAASKKGGA